METHKLRIKIGPHEFEAEGTKEAVAAQFEAWQQLVASLPPEKPDAGRPKIPRTVTEIKTPEGRTAPWDVFYVDDKRKLVTLRVHPSGENRDGDAGLLILYGYRQCFPDGPEGR